MPIEVAHTIAELDQTWPLNGDPLSPGAAHIRQLKRVLKDAFPGVGGDGYASAIQSNETEWGYCVGLTSAIQDQIDASNGAMVPTTTILPYFGLFANIPANYQLCDGTNGTPDLTDQFIMGTATEGSIGDTGGQKDSALIDHKHVFTHNHTGYTDNPGDHNHTVPQTTATTNPSSGKASTAVAGSVTNWDTDVEPDHTHPVTVNSTNVTSSNPSPPPSNDGIDDNMPAYIKLAFITRVT